MRDLAPQGWLTLLGGTRQVDWVGPQDSVLQGWQLCPLMFAYRSATTGVGPSGGSLLVLFDLLTAELTGDTRPPPAIDMNECIRQHAAWQARATPQLVCINPGTCSAVWLLALASVSTAPGALALCVGVMRRPCAHVG